MDLEELKRGLLQRVQQTANNVRRQTLDRTDLDERFVNFVTQPAAREAARRFREPDFGIHRDIGKIRLRKNAPTVGEAFQRTIKNPNSYLPYAMTQPHFTGGNEWLRRNITKPLGHAANIPIQGITLGLLNTPEMPKAESVQDRVGQAVGLAAAVPATLTTGAKIFGGLDTIGGNALKTLSPRLAKTKLRPVAGELAQTLGYAGAAQATGKEFNSALDFGLGLGLRGGLSALAPLAKLKGVNPKAFDLHRDDALELEGIAQKIRKGTQLTKQDDETLKRTFKRLFPGYKLDKMSNKKILNVLAATLDRYNEIPKQMRTPYPKMGVIDEAGMPSAKNTMKAQERVTDISRIKDLDARELAEEIQSVGARINTDETVTLYHRTTPEAAEQIRKTGEMFGKEDGVFFSTKPTGQAEGFGEAVVEVRVPLKDLRLDDIFSDEAHLRIPTKKIGERIKVNVVQQQVAKSGSGLSGNPTHPVASQQSRAGTATQGMSPTMQIGVGADMRKFPSEQIIPQGRVAQERVTDMEKVYHFTTNKEGVLREGFDLTKKTGLGGLREKPYVSMTDDVEIAKQLKQKFEVALDIANGKIKTLDDFWRVAEEIDPKGVSKSKPYFYDNLDFYRKNEPGYDELADAFKLWDRAGVDVAYANIVGGIRRLKGMDKSQLGILEADLPKGVGIRGKLPLDEKGVASKSLDDYLKEVAVTDPKQIKSIREHVPQQQIGGERLADIDQINRAKSILQNNTFKEFEVKGYLGLDPKYEPQGIPRNVWKQAAKELGLTEASIKEGTPGNFHVVQQQINDIPEDIIGRSSLVDPMTNVQAQSTKTVQGMQTGELLGQTGKTANRTTASQSQINNTTVSQDVGDYIQNQVAKQQGARGSASRYERLKEFIGDIRSKFVDETIAIEKVLNGAERSGQFRVRPTNDIRIQIDRTLRADSLASQFAKDKGFTKVVQDVPDLDAFNQYLIAKHALRVGKKGIVTGRNAQKDRRLISELSGQYEPFARELRKYQDALLDYKVQSGFITPELAQALRKEYPDYVPLNRIFSELEEDIMRIPTGQGGVASVATQNVLKRLKGSEREIANPLESILDATAVAFRQGERNKAAQMLVSYKDLPGNPFGLRELSSKELVRGKHTISAFIDGQKRTFETLPEIAEAARNLDAQQFGLLGQIFAVPTRILKLGAVGVNLPFIASNIVRDQLFSTVTSNKVTKTSALANPINFGRALFNAIGHGKDYDAWVRSGGSFTSFDIARNMNRQTINRIRADKNMGTKALYTATSPKEWLRAVENAVGRAEEMTRIQQFTGTRDALLKEGRTLEDATLLAQKAANFNTANFARKGSWSKVVNGVLPFFSAGIAGARSLVRSAQQNPKGFAARFTTSIALPTATVTAWNLSDPNRKAAYDDIPDYEKASNLIIVPPNPVQDEDGNWNVIKVPITPGLSNLMSIVRRQVEGVHGVNPDTALKILGDVATAGTSLNVSEPRQFFGNLVPQGVKPAIETMLNRNLFTGREIVPFYMRNLPPEEQVFDRTSGTARVVGDIFNTSPLVVENAISTSFAGVGRQIVNTTDRALARAGVIPEEQVGGRSVGEDITFRFTKARGGETERREEREQEEIRRELTRGGSGLVGGASISGDRVQKIALLYKVDELADTPTTTLARAKQEKKLWEKAQDIYNNTEEIKDFTNEERDEVLRNMGINPQDVAYYDLAKQENRIKSIVVREEAQTLLSTNKDRSAMLQRLVELRRDVQGEIVLSSGVIDDLVDEGIISYEEGKQLKKIEFGQDGQPEVKVSGRGRSAKLKNVKFVPLDIDTGSAGNVLSQAENLTQLNQPTIQTPNVDFRVPNLRMNMPNQPVFNVRFDL